MVRFLKSGLPLLFVGLGVGLAIGLLWPSPPIEAVAVDRDDKLVITTCPIDTDNEAVFILDQLTLDLKGAVISQQMKNKFTAFYHTNLLQDFGLEAAKNPKFVLVPGITNLQGGGRDRPGKGVIYVAETTTGNILAYGIPWNAQKMSTPSTNKLLVVDGWRSREGMPAAAATKTR